VFQRENHHVPDAATEDRTTPSWQEILPPALSAMSQNFHIVSVHSADFIEANLFLKKKHKLCLQ